MRFMLSTKKHLHERRSGTFLQWLSDIGGLNDAIVLIFNPLVSYISYLSFSLSLTNDMPSVDNNSDQSRQNAQKHLTEVSNL